MSNQNQVVLALGSNQGNRLKNIQLAIDTIHNEVGTVVKISRLYEFPAWGFTSESFYNCALLLHTTLSGQEILEKILAIEQTLGRVRSSQEGYQPRVIDIDIIVFNEDIIDTKNLQVPHSLMHERLFVLLPMLDLNLDWTHPVLLKKIKNCWPLPQIKVIIRLFKI